MPPCRPAGLPGWWARAAARRPASCAEEGAAAASDSFRKGFIHRHRPGVARCAAAEGAWPLTRTVRLGAVGRRGPRHVPADSDLPAALLGPGPRGPVGGRRSDTDSESPTTRIRRDRLPGIQRSGLVLRFAFSAAKRIIGLARAGPGTQTRSGCEVQLRIRCSESVEGRRGRGPACGRPVTPWRPQATATDTPSGQPLARRLELGA